VGRKPRQIKRVDFGVDDLSQVVGWMALLAEAEDGWINLIPKVADDDERPTSLGFFTLLSGGGDSITMCTWIPGVHDHSRRNQSSLGISHLTRHRAATQLYSAAVPIPETWFVEQDHPRRGLVLRIPSEESHAQVLAWALRAVAALRPRPTKGWRAEIHLPTQE
jgi:hypothetical protein